MSHYGGGDHLHATGMAHAEPEHVRAAAERDAKLDMGLGDDILHIAGFVLRAVTWPLRVAFRVVRRSQPDRARAVAAAVALLGLALFLAGDVLWVAGRARGRPIDLRVTGSLILAGVLLVLLAAFVLRED